MSYLNKGLSRRIQIGYNDSHQCEVITDSQSCLPKLPPQAGCFSRLIRSLRKKFIVSRANPRTLLFFRSEAAAKAEKKRQLRCPWFVIHPFSQFSILREMAMCVVWMAMFILGPIMMAFAGTLRQHTHFIPYVIVFFGVSLGLNLITCFFLGYHVTKTKEVVLAPKRIALHYLRTYFIVDLVSVVPTCAVISYIFDEKNSAALAVTTVIEGIGYFRLGTMLVYLRQITLHLRVGDTLHEFLCLVILTLLIIHWLACAAYFLPSIMYLFDGTVNPKSWTIAAKVPPNESYHAFGMLYGESYVTAISCFLGAGHGEYATECTEEQAFFCFVYILGACYMAYMIVAILEMVRSARGSENKYEEVIYQLNQYMRNKQLPHELRNRLLLYYQNRFQMRYFRETAILSTLSEHQRNELFLHSCKELLDSAKLFQGMPKTVVGVIMGSLKHEVYITSDVILKAGSMGECMFFIDKGTVAEVLAVGKEVRHLEDGEQFGEMPLILAETRGKRIVSYVATEITECFRLEKKELLHIMTLFEEFGERLTKQARERRELLLQMQEDEDYIMNRKDVLYDLRSGKILEKARPRLPVDK